MESRSSATFLSHLCHRKELWFVKTSRELARTCVRVVCRPTSSLLRLMLLQATGSARNEKVSSG